MIKRYIYVQPLFGCCCVFTIGAVVEGDGRVGLVDVDVEGCDGAVAVGCGGGGERRIIRELFIHG